MNVYKIKKKRFRQRRLPYHIYIVIIFLIIIFIFFTINFIGSFLLPEKLDLSQLNDTHTSIPDIILSNCHNYSMHYVYIDIGCFNGETVEHFIHFNPNSSFYDIITFEPDPYNYKLCKKRLTQKKYTNINIIILSEIVWIRNEEIYFQIEGGRKSRIKFNRTAADNNSKQLHAIDFSSWLARLVKPNKTKVHIKMSIPGAELLVLEKMIHDDTLKLADKYEIEWTDRKNPIFVATRIYIQSMFDSTGFDAKYYTRLQDVRQVFQMNGTYTNVTKHYDWKNISDTDTYMHYSQRPDVLEPLHVLKKIGKIK